MSDSGQPIEQRAQGFYEAVFDSDLIHLMDVAEGFKKPNKRERADGIRDANDAHQRLEAYSYGIGKEVIYYVTLAGGGPAARLEVRVDEYGDVGEAILQFCDWFEPWTDAPRQDAELVARYARLVGYYGEGVA